MNPEPKKIKGDLYSEFVCKTVRRRDGLLVKIVVHPTAAGYDYYVVVEKARILQFKLWIYSTETDSADYPSLFSQPRWKNSNELALSSASQDMEISVFINECKATVKHRTARPEPILLSAIHRVARVS